MIEISIDTTFSFGLKIKNNWKKKSLSHMLQKFITEVF